MACNISPEIGTLKKDHYKNVRYIYRYIVQAVVGSIVWAFRTLKKPRYGEMSARTYALYTRSPQTFLFRYIEGPL